MNIKRTFFLLIAIMIAGISVGQTFTSFTSPFSTTEDEKCTGIVEMPGVGYFLSIIRGTYSIDDPGCFNYRSIVYKMDLMGNITDSITFYNTDSLIFPGRGIILTGNELLLWCSVYDAHDTYHRKALRLTTLNENLEVYYDTIFSKSGYYLTQGVPSINESGNIVLAVHPEDISTGKWYAAALELTTTAGLVKEVVTDSLLPSGKVVPLPGNNGYIFADISMVVLLDNDLNFVKQLYVPQVIEPHLRLLNSFKTLSDSSVIITGFVDEPVQWWEPHRDDAAWAVLDKNGQWLSQHAFGIYGYNDYAGGVDFITLDNIYITRRNSDSNLLRFCLFSFKADGTENWHQCYTYNGYELLNGLTLATSDSTCLMVCSYQTENSGYNEFDLVVMKLNRDGTITSINQPEKEPVNISVYPNPGQATISVSCKVTGCLFSLYDNTGRLILQKKLLSDNETLDTGKLSSGFYTYRVTGCGSVVATGKWIKH
jgi:hypothetical protein